MLGGIGALAYYGYSQGWFSAFLGTPAAASPAVGTNLATGQPAATGTQTGSPAVHTWAGPSLDQMYTALLAAEQAAMSASVPDPALTCLVVPGSTTSNAVNTTPITSGSIATNPNAARTATGQALSTPIYTQSALSGLGAVSCAMPLATYDVHNWYLVESRKFRDCGGARASGPYDSRFSGGLLGVGRSFIKGGESGTCRGIWPGPGSICRTGASDANTEGVVTDVWICSKRNGASGRNSRATARHVGLGRCYEHCGDCNSAS